MRGNTNTTIVVAKEATPSGPSQSRRTKDAGYSKSKALRRLRRSIIITILAAALFTVLTPAQKPTAQKSVVPPAGVQIVSIAGEPELRVDGVPFFIHAAQFDYFRIPPDLWFRSLDRYQELGINTIDLRIPWNWHEVRDAEFDFDGHTNPRRNLRGLLQIIAEKHLKFVARPGPLIGDHWRNAGYPGWLLGYSDYEMNESDIHAGLAPLDAELAVRDGNAAARDWLANATHMTYARRWLTAIAKELAPYSSRNVFRITNFGEREVESQGEEISGPLLFVALDDAVGFPTGSDGADLSLYRSEIRRALVRGGLDAGTFMNAPSILKQGAPSLSTPSATEKQKGVGLTGEWLFHPSMERPVPNRTTPPSSEPHIKSRLTTLDASSLSFLANSLGTQPDFPPLLSGFATTTFAPAGDIRAAQPPPENMLLASRLLLGSGIRGITYTPLQDTLTPGGWGTPSAARYFRWDAALDLAGNYGSRANGVTRNGQLISTWGAMLASSHTRADFGIVDLRTCLGAPPVDESSASHIAHSIEQIFRVSGLAGFTPELINPDAQSVERLLRDRVILLPVPEENGSNLPLTGKAQTALVEFVRRGGVLIYFPTRPQGTTFAPLWQSAPAGSAMRENIVEWPFERGRVTASSNDFYSWVSLTENLEQNRTQAECSPAIENLTTLLAKAGVDRNLRRAVSSKPNPDVFITQLVSNAASAMSARPRACVEEQLCAAALVSVTNLSPDEAADESFEILDPQAGAGVNPPTIAFNVTVPARESLLLPVHAPLCAASADERCTDEVISSGAELLGAEREGKILKLIFYAPARATVLLHLESQPTKVELGEDFRLESQWKQETGELEFSLLRGAAPAYRRVLRVHLRYTPHVYEKSILGKNHPKTSEYEVFDAIRLPLTSDASIPSGPPLILTGTGGGGQLTVTSWNRTDGIRLIDFSLDGAFHGAGGGRVFPGEQLFSRLRFQPTHNSTTADAASIPGADGLLRGQLTLRSGHEHGSTPIFFVSPNEAGNAHYQYDFDRDGAPEWVLESNQLRLIVSPADGGRALALVDKSTNGNLITPGGALHDFLIPETFAPAAAPASGDFAFNRAYRAAWIEEKQGTSLQLAYSQHENSLAGLHVEKTVRLAAPETVEATYHISLGALASSNPEDDLEPKQAFVSMLSIPATGSEEESTHFCWQSAISSASNTIPNVTAKPVSGRHCEDFVVSGQPVAIPAEITHLEIQTSGRRTLTVDWTSAHTIIVPMNFSAQVEFVIPAPAPGAAPAEFTLRYTVGEPGP